MKMIAAFDAQAWVKDDAISVDAQGESKWDCTSYVKEIGITEVVKESIKHQGYWLDCDDVLKGDVTAPVWVREWTGPFTITVSMEDDCDPTFCEMPGCDWEACQERTLESGNKIALCHQCSQAFDLGMRVGEAVMDTQESGR